MVRTENFELLEISSADALRSWLLMHHKQAESIWLVTYKKSVPERYVSREQVLDELLCFGWIDGIRRKKDDNQTMQLISPRRAQHWAKSYKDRVANLRAEGKMHPSGEAAITRSKDEGLWNFMDDVDQLLLPKDFQLALSKFEGATEFFQGINDSSKRFVLRWIKLAKTEATRKKRIEKIALLSSKGEKLPGS